MIVGLFARHIKAYQKLTFIPVGDCNFASYVGKNGIGKSSILEALNSFLNGEAYPVNKNATGTNLYANNILTAPIFVIEKTRINDKEKREFLNHLSESLWDIQQKDCLNIVNFESFIALREKLKEKKDKYFFFTIGEKIDNKQIVPTCKFLNNLSHLNNEKELDDKEAKEKENKQNDLLIKTLKTIKNLYSLIYIPIEISAEKFTKLETNEMQKIIGTSLKEEIKKIVGKMDINDLNKSLQSFLEKITQRFKGKYNYDTGYERKNSITVNMLTDKIIESYFQTRFLFRDKRKISELSAGEKRQALIDIINAFLEKENRELYTIIALDEPEASLHTSLCYEQFEKLHKIALNSKTQVLITTHWYGFLPILNQGLGHFLNESEDDKKEIKIESYNLINYRSEIKRDIQNSNGKIPCDLILKSQNDLVQSIYHSLFANPSYNWLIVEGISEKIYFDFFFQDEFRNCHLKILPLGGNSEVLKIYKYLDLALENNKKKTLGKIFCLIDTDEEKLGGSDEVGESHSPNNLKIRRFGFDKEKGEITLLALNSKQTTPISIEQSLNSEIFKKTIEKLDTSLEIRIQNPNIPSLFKNLECYRLEDFFNHNNGENKIVFAKKYIQISKEEGQDTLPWITTIKDFFRK